MPRSADHVYQTRAVGGAKNPSIVQARGLNGSLAEMESDCSSRDLQILGNMPYPGSSSCEHDGSSTSSCEIELRY